LTNLLLVRLAIVDQPFNMQLRHGNVRTHSRPCKSPLPTPWSTWLETVMTYPFYKPAYPAAEIPGTDLGIALDSTSVVEEIRKAQEQSDDPVGLEFSCLWYKGHKLYIPNDPKLLLSEFHDSPIASHFGRDSTIAAVKRCYTSQRPEIVSEYVAFCKSRHLSKPSRLQTTGKLGSIPILS